jgi:hypothetical protein
MKSPRLLHEGDSYLFRSFCHPARVPFPFFRTMAGHQHMNHTHSMHHHMNNITDLIHISKSIVDKDRTESVFLLELHSPDSADLPHLAVPYRRHHAEIRPYSRWRIYVSLDIRY